MKEAILKKIAPLIDKFALSLEALEIEAQKALQMAQDERLQAEGDRASLKNDALKQAEEHRKQLNLLKDKSYALDMQKKELGVAVSEQTRLNGEITLKLREAETNTQETENIKNSIASTLEEKRKLNSDLKLKGNLLKDDFQKLELKNKDYADRLGKLVAREKACDKREEEVIGQNYELSQRELKVATDEKRIKQEWGRINAGK
jgi:chromosome segregation ATPase